MTQTQLIEARIVANREVMEMFKAEQEVALQLGNQERAKHCFQQFSERERLMRGLCDELKRLRGKKR